MTRSEPEERECKFGCKDTIAGLEQVSWHYYWKHPKEFIELLTNPKTTQPSQS